MNKHLNEESKNYILKTVSCGIFFCTEENCYVLIMSSFPENKKIILPQEMNLLIDNGLTYKQIYEWLYKNNYIITAHQIFENLKSDYENNFNCYITYNK